MRRSFKPQVSRMQLNVALWMFPQPSSPSSWHTFRAAVKRRSQRSMQSLPANILSSSLQCPPSVDGAFNRNSQFPSRFPSAGNQFDECVGVLQSYFTLLDLEKIKILPPSPVPPPFFLPKSDAPVERVIVDDSEFKEFASFLGFAKKEKVVVLNKYHPPSSSGRGADQGSSP